MAGDGKGAPGVWLEGLILRDGSGVFYEVPCVVIERYRVAEAVTPAYGEEVAGYAGGTAAGATLGGQVGWVVEGGIYGPPPDHSPT